MDKTDGEPDVTIVGTATERRSEGGVWVRKQREKAAGDNGASFVDFWVGCTKEDGFESETSCAFEYDEDDPAEYKKGDDSTEEIEDASVEDEEECGIGDASERVT